MRKKEYKAPKIDITKFECAEDIMSASMNTLRTSITTDTGHTYVSTSSKKWKDIYGE